MAIKTINNFMNCDAMVEDLRDPESGELNGRAIVYIDKDSGDVWRYAVPLDAAKQLGQLLMGIGSVQLANNGELAKELKKSGRPQG